MYKENISIKPNGLVLVEFLPNSLCLKMIDAIHNKLNFGRRLFCNGFVPRTPVKDNLPSSGTSSTPLSSTTESLSANKPLQPQSELGAVSRQPAVNVIDTSKSNTLSMPILVPNPVSPMTPNTFSQHYSETPDFNLQQVTGEDLARRNSLSLRSPPLGSVAAELINSDT